MNNKLEYITINGYDFGYDIHGDNDGLAIVLLTGWCQDYRMFDGMVEELSKTHKVIRINWRGHTYPSIPVDDHGPKEQAEDIMCILNALNVDKFIPLSTSHGGWANIELCSMLSRERIPRSIVMDWIMVEAGEEFLQSLQDTQNPNKWINGRQSLFDHWVGVSDNQAVKKHLNCEMAAFGFDMWARSCKVIENNYYKWGSPLKRMAALESKLPIIHIYSQAAVEDYEKIQREFIKANQWFDFKIIEGQTHFPTIESPGKVVKAIQDFTSGEKVQEV